LRENRSFAIRSSPRYNWTQYDISKRTAELIARTPENKRDTAQFARLLNDFAAHCHVSNYSEAEAYYKQSLAIWERALWPTHPYVAVSLANRAALYRKTKDFHEAE
jgi:hypothetical protein